MTVVCALIERGGRLLVAQRASHQHLAGQWEFPGGKVEPEETPAGALVREIREELGCEIELLHALPASSHAYPAVSITLLPFVCRLQGESAEPRPHEHAALRWLTPAELNQLELAAADRPVCAAYQAFRQLQP